MGQSICDVPGLRVGHFHLEDAQTGCSVILPDAPAVCGMDVRGSAPGSREIELLKPVRLVQRIHGLLLTGGSAFGLDAAGGVQRFLEEQGIGFDTGIVKVPLVPAAVIFDLGTGDPSVRPDAEMGYRACQQASAAEVRQGRIGAGRGATVGKLLGMQHVSPGGIGMASETLGDSLKIGVLGVVNALGEIVAKDGSILAGIRGKDGFIPAMDIIRKQGNAGGFPSNTTLTVVATNAKLDRENATKVAQMAQDGLARAIRPAHTMHDGDIVFALSTGEIEMDVNVIGAVAAELTAESIRNAVRYIQGD